MAEDSVTPRASIDILRISNTLFISDASKAPLPSVSKLSNISVKTLSFKHLS